LLTYAKAERAPPADEDSTRRRPGDAAPRRGSVGSEELIDEVIENRVCAKCHETAREPGKAVATLPLQLRQSWMVHAHFTHDAHAWQKCDDCHTEQGSAIAEDLSLPTIESCRQCHGGVNSPGRLQSTCVDCHRFHEASKLTFRTVTGALADGQAAGERKQ
jgi:DnaJ-class molecular chaperone